MTLMRMNQRTALSFGAFLAVPLVALCATQATAQPFDAGPWWLTPAVEVNHAEGYRLNANGALFRATSIRVYAPDVNWKYKQGDDGTEIHSPTGHGRPAPDDFTCGGANMYGIVIYQKDGNGQVFNVRNVEGFAEGNATLIQGLNPFYDIYVNVNDGRGAYGDNGGYFKLVFQGIQ